MSTQSILWAATLMLWALCAGCSDSQYTKGAAFGDSNGVTGVSNGERASNETSNGTTSGETTPGPYRYISIEDLSLSEAGDAHPGADIDAVSVVVDGVERFATTVEDHNVFHTGASIMTERILDDANSSCEATNFVSLGGVENDAWIMLGFSDDDTDFTFGSGAIINVYTFDTSSCSDPPSSDENLFRVSVFSSNTTRMLVGVATIDTNQFMVP